MTNYDLLDGKENQNISQLFFNVLTGVKYILLFWLTHLYIVVLNQWIELLISFVFKFMPMSEFKLKLQIAIIF